MSEPKKRHKRGKRGGVKHRERVRQARARDARLRSPEIDVMARVMDSPYRDEPAKPNLSALRARMSQLALRRAG